MKDTRLMKQNVFILLFAAILITGGFSNIALAAGEPPTISVDEILKKVETRYGSQGFSAHFFQTSVIASMDITETASGSVMIKRPGMMRWTYEIPQKQTIVTDGKTLWIYRPDDHQVSMGSAPTFFGGGKGAGFLSNIQEIRKSFEVNLEKINVSREYVLRLIPIQKTYDIDYVKLHIDGDTFDIVEAVTTNSYKDETRIELSNIQMNQQLDDNLFQFVIPQGAEVIRLDE
ncbi:MAG: outer membrane lipoprotein chaperone LolA [Desulfatirhabdiaceae bacterium]